MCKKLFLLIVVCLVSSAGAITIEDPILLTDISPVAVTAVDNGQIWGPGASIDRNLATNFGFDPAAATDSQIEMVFDMGSVRHIESMTWWNRATSNHLFALNVDVYDLGTGGTPLAIGGGTLVDMDLLATPHTKNDVQIFRHDLDITDFWGRWIGLVFDDGPWSGGNIQGSEIAFQVPEPATMLLLGLGGLALIRRKR